MPIIQSLSDLDYYKLTMAQVAWYLYADVRVRYAFKNRTKKVALALAISLDELRRELEHVRTLRFTEDELAFLRESPHLPRGLFREEFLDFLRGLELPPCLVAREGDTYRIEVEGAWPVVIFWETIVLAIVNELYYRAELVRRCQRLPDVLNVLAEGRRRLTAKIELLKAHPEIKFSDFGTRRRFNRAWQEEVVQTLAKEVPGQLLGTSNVHLARKFGLRPIGTFAHEMDMVFSGIFHGSDDEIRASHNRVLQVWWEMYGEPLSIALTDTYGTDFFLEDMTAEQARLWRGLRQDSGDPIAFGEKAIAFYERHGIDPRTKVIVFSDGLDIEAIVRLAEHFAGRIQVVFGWGTNLTNDLGLEALSLVVKVVEANGHGTVKFSDNFAKAMGSPADIERFMRIFGYEKRLEEACRY